MSVCLSGPAVAKELLSSTPRKRYLYRFSTHGFSKNLPFESYGVKKPIANEYSLTVAMSSTIAVAISMVFQLQRLLKLFKWLMATYTLSET